jgi:hypothetical protein
MTTDDDRIAYLAGEGSGALDDADVHDLDELKGFLSDPAMWAEPAGELEDRVVAAIAAERAHPGSPAETDVPTSIRRAGWHRRLALGAVAAAAAILVAAVAVAPDDRHPSETLAAVLDPTELVPDAHGQATFTRTDSGWRGGLGGNGFS